MSKMDDFIIYIQDAIEEGELTYKQIAEKYNVPLEWVQSLAVDIVADSIGVTYDDKPF